MKTRNVAEKVAVVPSESKGIGATIAKLMRQPSVIDIVERFQTQHATARGARNGIRSRGSRQHVARSHAAFADPVNQMIQRYKHKGNPNHEN